MVAAGDAQMAETFGESSTQYSFLYQFSGTCAAGTELTVTGENGTELVRFAPEQDYQCVVVSAPELTEGTYTVSAGDESGEIALSGVSSSNGSGMAGGFGGHGGGPGGDGGQFQPGGQRPDGGMELPEGMESMEPPGDMESMELPEGMEMPDDMEMPGGPGQGGRDFGGKEPDGGQTKG